MPQFFFNIVGAGSYAIDREGLSFPSLDDAYLEACRAALDISFEMLRRRCDPNDHRFEIIDQFGAILMDLPFSEVLRPLPSAKRPPSADDLQDTVVARLARNRALRMDLADQIGTARRNVLVAQALLSRSRKEDVQLQGWTR